MREETPRGDFEWFDAWCEDHSRLMDEEDYPALVECCRQRLRKSPGDSHAVESLAEAYILNGQGSEALRLVTPYYNDDPDNLFWQWPILEALHSMGKDMEDFQWKAPPNVLTLADGVADECYRFLEPKRKPRTLSELYSMLLVGAYLWFSEDDLLNVLRADDRFSIKNPDEEMWAEISAHRKTK